MARLIWTEESERWLKDIFDYIASDDPHAAASVVNGIHKRAQLLLQFPQSGYRYGNSAENVRVLLYNHCRIAYVIEGADITVLGVFHGAIAIERYLSNEFPKQVRDVGRTRASYHNLLSTGGGCRQ